MAKQKRKTLDDHIHKHFNFKDTNEYIIFLLWAMFVTAFLISLIKR